MAQKSKTKFSYSRLETMSNCPFSYYLKYVQGEYLFSPTIHTVFGSLIHKILEDEANAIKRGELIDYDALEEEFTKTSKVSANAKDKDKLIAIDEIAKMFPEEWNSTDSKSGKSFKEKAQDFITDGLYRLPKYMEEHPELEIVGCEIPFTFQYKDYTFTGYIDRLFREKGTNRFIIHDIKTKDTLFTDTATCLQFVIYTLALIDKYGEDITVECFYDLPVIDTFQPVCTKGYLERGKKKLDKLFAAIENKEFSPHPTPLCYWCPYRFNGATKNEFCKELCCYFSLWTPDDKNFKTKMEWKGMDKHFVQMKKFTALQAIDEAIDDDDFEI